MKRVTIYKNNEPLAEFPSIQKAAHFMKSELGRERFPWTIINKGIQDNEFYTHTNGSVYSFDIDELGRAKRESSKENQYSSSITSKFSRVEFIEFLSQHLEEIIQLKLQISDPRLKQYHLSPKGLGDDLYFLTESYHRQNDLYKGKYSMTDFITPQALLVLQQKEKKKLIFEHIVPKNLYLKMLVDKAYQENLTYEEIYKVLMKYYYTCTVTKEEDDSLPSTSMQEGWDGHNPFYRYQLAGIEFIENPKLY